MFFPNSRIKFLERENAQLKDHVEILEQQLNKQTKLNVGYVKVTKALNKQLMECQKKVLKKEK